jgi:hypothetical protein
MWLKIVNKTKWNFPNCLGAMDGKHVEIIVPPHSGSRFYNYFKQTFCIVLLGMADAKHKFIYSNAGIQGRISNGGVFKHPSLYEKLFTNSLNILQPAPSLTEKMKLHLYS